jgi:hypothetical protein
MQEPPKGADQKEQRPHGRKELSRQDLPSTAEHVFGLHGFHEASLQAIAVRAAFSTAPSIASSITRKRFSPAFWHDAATIYCRDCANKALAGFSRKYQEVCAHCL